MEHRSPVTAPGADYAVDLVASVQRCERLLNPRNPRLAHSDLSEDLRSLPLPADAACRTDLESLFVVHRPIGTNILARALAVVSLAKASGEMLDRLATITTNMDDLHEIVAASESDHQHQGVVDSTELVLSSCAELGAANKDLLMKLQHEAPEAWAKLTQTCVGSIAFVSFESISRWAVATLQVLEFSSNCREPTVILVSCFFAT